MTNSWRAIARQARDRIVEADPEDVSFILSVSLGPTNPSAHAREDLR